MHARIHEMPLCEAVLDYDDNCAREWFNSEKGMRWELPGSVKLDATRHGTKCSKCSRTKQIYDAEWGEQHHQAYDVDVDPEEQPKHRKCETLRRNCWNKANRCCRDHWLLNSRLSRQEAFHGAYELGKKCLKSKKDYDELMETMLEQAKTAWSIATATNLADHLVDEDGATRFEDEANSFDILTEHLASRGVSVRRARTENALGVFQKWLDSDKSTPIERSDFDFLRSVNPSAAVAARESEREIQRRERGIEKFARMVLYTKIALFIQKLKRAELEARAKAEAEKKEKERQENEVRKKREREARAPLRARRNRLELEEKRQALTNEAPKVAKGSDPPQHNPPTEQWKRYMMDIFIHARNIVEWVCVTHMVNVPSFVSESSRREEVVSEEIAEFGLATRMFTEEDLASYSTINSHMKTWAPAPWRESFNSYVASFHEIITADTIGAVSRTQLDAFVEKHMDKCVKPKASRDAFKSCLLYTSDAADE